MLDWLEGLGVSGTARLRASDAEREEVVHSLKHHYAQGRLDEDELGARVERAYGAVTVAELDRLTADLPREPIMPPAPPARSRAAGVSLVALMSLLAVMAIAVAALMPPEVMAMLLALSIPLAVLAVSALFTLALPALVVFALARAAREMSQLGRARSYRVLAAPRQRTGRL